MKMKRQALLTRICRSCGHVRFLKKKNHFKELKTSTLKDVKYPLAIAINYLAVCRVGDSISLHVCKKKWLEVLRKIELQIALMESSDRRHKKIKIKILS